MPTIKIAFRSMVGTTQVRYYGAKTKSALSDLQASLQSRGETCDALPQPPSIAPDILMLFKVFFGILLAVAFYLTVAAWLGFSSQEEPAPQTHQSDQKTKSSENKGDALRSAIKRGFILQGEFIHDFREEIVAVGTLFIAAFTVILAFATGFLYLATRELVEGADKNAEKQLRAYVGLQNMQGTVYPFDQGGFVVVAHTEARNFGQTPAYGMTVQANAIIDVPEAIPFDDSQGTAKIAGAMTAFKDVGFQISQTRIITSEDAQAIKDQKKIIYFWGTIKYRDAFKGTHKFKFRLISNALVIGSVNVWNMVAHPLGFEDEE